MMIFSKDQTEKHNKKYLETVLRSSLKRTYLSYSLEHCFPIQKSIDQVIQSKKCQMRSKLKEIEFEKEREILQDFYQNSCSQLQELTQYYKYYTQTSVILQSNFIKLMHNHREQRKIVQYNRLKKMLDLSNTTINESTKNDRQMTQQVLSCFILDQLSLTNSLQESIMLERLKIKLQKDFGPNNYRTIEQIDKQYYFTKPVQITTSIQNGNIKPIAQKKNSKNPSDRQVSNKKGPIKNKRNNSCDINMQSSGICKDVKSRIKRQKHCSMDNLNSLTRESSMRATKSTVYPKAESEIKSKILGVKERIRQQKQILLRKVQQNKSKKQVITEKPNRKLRN